MTLTKQAAPKHSLWQILELAKTKTQKQISKQKVS
jgi:hypothetical protein